jgi:hypothetical protein
MNGEVVPGMSDGEALVAAAVVLFCAWGVGRVFRTLRRMYDRKKELSRKVR